MKSPRTTLSGLGGGIALVLLGVVLIRRGDTEAGVLVTLAGVSQSAQGWFTRDRDETSEGTDARIRRRNPQHPMDP